MVLKAKIQILVLGLVTQVIGLGLLVLALSLTVVIGLGLGLGLDSVGRLDAIMLMMLYTCVRLEKILTHYIDTINSVSFDSDTKLADICSQMDFVPLGYLLERIVAVAASSAPVERVFSKSGLLVRRHRAKMSDKLMETLVFAKCSIFS